MHAVRFTQCLQPDFLCGLGGYAELGGFVGPCAGLVFRGVRFFVRTRFLSASAPTATSGHVKRRAGEGRHAWSVNDEPYIGRGAPQWHYFVEFRARNAVSYGHLYVMFGKVNDRHEIIKSEVAGFFPAGDDRKCVNCSVYNWTIGHVLPVPSFSRKRR